MSGLLHSTKGKLAVAGALLLVVAGGWFFVVSPEQSQANELDTKIGAAQAELAQRHLALAKPSASVQVMPADLFRLTKAMPDVVDMPGILLDMTRLTGQNHLDFRSVAPSTPVPGTGYLAQPVAVVVQGRFTDVSSFLGDLRSLVTVQTGRLDTHGRLYSVSEVDLGQADHPGVFPVVKATVTLNAYSYNPASPATTPQPPTTSTPSSSGTVAAGATH